MPRKSNNPAAGLYRRPRADIYTALLLIALLALILGIYTLYVEMSDYNFEFRGAPSVSTPAGDRAAFLAILTAPEAVRETGVPGGALGT